MERQEEERSPYSARLILAGNWLYEPPFWPETDPDLGHGPDRPGDRASIQVRGTGPLVLDHLGHGPSALPGSGFGGSDLLCRRTASCLGACQVPSLPFLHGPDHGRIRHRVQVAR